jgi:hypothetical protein
MTRYERKLFFERLLALREAYRAEAHVGTELTLEGVVAFAEQAYNDSPAIEAPTTPLKGAAKAD